MTSTKGLPDEKVTVVETVLFSLVQLALLERDLLLDVVSAAVDDEAGVDSLVERPLHDEPLETEA